MTRPVAYLRKSKVTSDRHVSWEVQEQDVRKLAAQYGDEDLLILSDWSRSGREAATRLRKDYLRANHEPSPPSRSHTARPGSVARP